MICVVKQPQVDEGRCTAVQSDACSVVGVGSAAAWQSCSPRQRQSSLEQGQLKVTKETKDSIKRGKQA